MASSMTDWSPAGTMLRCKTRCCAGSGGRKAWDTESSPPPLRCSRAWRWNIQPSKNGKHKQKTWVSIRKHFLKSKLLDISIAKSSFLSCIFVKNVQCISVATVVAKLPTRISYIISRWYSKKGRKVGTFQPFPMPAPPKSFESPHHQTYEFSTGDTEGMPRVLPSYLKNGSFWRYGFLLWMLHYNEMFCAFDGLQKNLIETDLHNSQTESNWPQNHFCFFLIVEINRKVYADMHPYKHTYTSPPSLCGLPIQHW